MRGFIVLAGALMLTACGMFGHDRPLAKGPLDGKTFAAKVVGDGTAEPDQLIFKDGTFRSATASRNGFAEATYTAVQQGEFMKFEAVASNPESGTLKWTGTIKGETIEGTAVWDESWWRPDHKYSFSGTLKD